MTTKETFWIIWAIVATVILIVKFHKRWKDQKYLRHLTKHSTDHPNGDCNYCTEEIRWQIEQMIK